MSGPQWLVTNAGPLMVLAKLNILHLFKQLYGRVHLAQSVYDEAVIEGLRRGHEDAHTLRLFLKQEGWQPQATDHIQVPADLQNAPLDTGERDSIALTLTQPDALVLMDEEAGRREARRRGLKVRGSLGVLIEAYQRQLITADQLRFYFAQISQRNDIWVSPTLCQRLLREVLGTEAM